MNQLINLKSNKSIFNFKINISDKIIICTKTILADQKFLKIVFQEHLIVQKKTLITKYLMDLIVLYKDLLCVKS